jgi:hypothetical protein
VGGQKGLLDRVLGFFERPEQMPAEREQRASMAIEQNLEGDLVALAELLDSRSSLARARRGRNRRTPRVIA